MKTTIKTTIPLLLIGAMTLVGQAAECQDTSSKSIVKTAASAGSFKTLLAAAEAAGLAGTLDKKGPFTVFAPTDSAFAGLPKGTLEDLLKPENKAKLQEILKYHVVSGKVGLSDALKVGSAATLQGAPVNIRFSDGKVRVQNATLVNADITASNGVIHVIDSVLLPTEPSNDIAAVAAKAGKFGTLLAAVKAAGLESVLTGSDPVTVLAPSDAAFEKLPDGTVKSLLKPENRDRLTEILKMHVVKGAVSAGDALNAGSTKSVGGNKLQFRIAEGSFKVNGVKIQTADIQADNGVIHVIDEVLLPPEGSATVDPASRIESAIRKGVPMFNNGNPAGCASIYMNCAKALVKDQRLEAATRKMLSEVVNKAKNMNCETTRAWVLRAGLDRAYQSMSRHN